VSFLFIIIYRYILQREDSRWRRHQLCTAHLAGQVENRIGTSRQLGHFEEGNKEIKRKLDLVVYILWPRWTVLSKDLSSSVFSAAQMTCS
jgi:hypothetical protein